MRKYIYLFVIPFILYTSCHTSKEYIIDLSGEWKFQIDNNNVGITNEWYNKNLTESIYLPGSMVENGKGEEVSVRTKWTGQIVDQSWYTDDKYSRYRKDNNVKIPFWLQPLKHYLGAAWYQKDIIIPNNWDNKFIELILERPHWETQLWINERRIGMRNSLGTSHIYNLTKYLKPGKNKLSIRVDNSIKEIDPGINSHSISDHTQSNWNGIVGEISLKAKSLIMIDEINLYPDVSKKEVMAKIRIKNHTGRKQDCTISLKPALLNINKNENIDKVSLDFQISDEKYLEIVCPMGDSPHLWDEFQANLYKMTVVLKSSEGIDQKQINFGMREFKVDGKRFVINGRPVFLRGTLECAIFPKTGYPSTNTEEWNRIFEVCKAHGLNHMRFHSWCPPEAAFNAADESGVYLQVECSSWANSGSSVGDGKPIDKWLYKEAEQILEKYGNHPSFCMMAYGNEPAGNKQLEYLGKFIDHMRNIDPRHVYTGGAGWPYIEDADYYNNHEPRIQGWGQGLNSIINKEAPQTIFDFEEIIEKSSIPYVSHEIGQWCVYPNFKEIEKYDGVLKAKNFEIFKETLEEAQLAHLADSFLLASGKLQALCYKADIEAALRTKDMAGFQLLDLHDFPGQGTALVGVLDAFWEQKGYISAEEFSRFSNETVPLARMEKRIFSNQEEFIAEIEVSHFGSYPLIEPKINWEISDKDGQKIAGENLEIEKLRIDNCQKVGEIRYPLINIQEATKLHLKVFVNGFSNGWDFWIFPENLPDPKNNDVYISDNLDDKLFQVLNNGGKVLLSMKKESLNNTYGGEIKLGFSSIFWNTAWTRGQAPHTLGILCDPNHEALKEFPTEYHSNWQWWDAMSNGQAIMLKMFKSNINPIVRVIDDWFENRSLGLVFEARIGNGKIIVSGIDLLTDLDNRLEAQQLLYSLKKYMDTDSFNPTSNILPEELKLLIN